MGRRSAAAARSLKMAVAITVVDLGVALFGRAITTMSFVALLGLVMLVESAGLMLFAGALSFSSQPGVRRLAAVVTRTEVKVTKMDLADIDAKAAVYALVGGLLFLESLVLATLTA